MIEILTEKKVIEKYQNRLKKRLLEICKKKNGKYKLRHLENCDLYYSYSNDFWFSPQHRPNRYWNAFGLGNPDNESNTPISIIVEINPPIEGLNRNIAGAFGRDENNEILILHRGRMNGISKQLFFDSCNEKELLQAIDGDQENYFYKIGFLESKFLAEEIKDFIKKVKELKNSTK